jgi:hypothetical protein
LYNTSNAKENKKRVSSERGESPSQKYSPSPFKERGIKGVRFI